MSLLRDQAVSSFQRKNDSFFKAFDTLYLYLNGIRDHKFIYLFSEGMSKSMKETIFGGKAMYNKLVKKLSAAMGRCGAVLFMINMRGVDGYSSDLSRKRPTAFDSDLNDQHLGESFLHFISKESGGKYLEGTDVNIADKITKLHRGFYELYFPDETGMKSSIRNISITAARKGVKITSVSSIEKTKPYKHMNGLEKEILVINLLTQPGNVMNRQILAYNANVEKVDKGKSKKTFLLRLPPGFKGRKLDLYKVRVAGDSDGKNSKPVTTIQKETVSSRKKKLSIKFKFKKNEKGPDDSATYFVLIDPESNSARVHGMVPYDDDPELIRLMVEKENIAKDRKRRSGEIMPEDELNRILDGTAAYCEKLKKSAFFFFCKEQVVERHVPLSVDNKNNDQIRRVRDPVYYGLRVKGDRVDVKVDKHEFSYRLLKKGRKIKEDREPLKTKITDENIPKSVRVIEHSAFMSQKAVFAPVTLFDRTRQEHYHYRFLRRDKWKDREVVVLEVLPRNEALAGHAIYGDIWIDKEDFSVLKIEAAPQSVRGYVQLKDLAMKMRTRLELSLESEFGAINEGIRFPTNVVAIEKYKGGPLINRHKGPTGWERRKTEFRYTDYQFFMVQTDVSATVEKVEVEQ